MARINPVKWSTEAIERFITQINETSKIPRHSPFWNNDASFLKPELQYGYTEEELIDVSKCEQDLFYFAETKAYIKQEEGPNKLIKLRPYQKKVLKDYNDHNKVVFLASRQIGKMLQPTSSVTVETQINNVSKITKKHLFELYYGQAGSTIFDKIKSFLYKILYKLEKRRYGIR